MRFVWKGSPNFGYGRGIHGQLRPHRWAKVYHITGGGTLQIIDDWFANPDAFASAHLCLDEREIHQYISFDDAAWHAGVLNQPDVNNQYVRRFVTEGKNPNRYTLGIEAVASPGDVLARGAWELLVRTSAELDCRFPELLDAPEAHLGHFQIDSVNRARDPVTVFQPRDVWKEHHMAELTDEQKAAIVQATLLPAVVEVEAILSRMTFYDSQLLGLLANGDLRELAEAALATKGALDQSVANAKARLDHLLAQLRYFGIRPGA